MLSTMLQNRQILKIEQNLRKKVLWPLGVFIVGSLAIFLFVSHYYLEVGLSRTQETYLQNQTSRYYNYMQERTGLMRSIMQQLGRDTTLVEALDRRDQTFLLQYVAPLFKELLAEQHITHFYFHSPDGTNLLRVHKPDRYGDLIDRVTLHQSQLHNNISDGIELGPLGTFTLRVVMPVHNQNRLVGYLELGEDIDPILDHLATEGDAKMAILIHKQFLNREAWLEGQSMLGESLTWGLLPDYVVGGLTAPELIEFLPQFATQEAINNSESVEVLLKSETHRGRFLNMMDAAGRSVGSLLVLQNVDNILQNHETSIWLITIFCLLLASALFMIALILLGRADQDLRVINEKLAKERSELEDPPPTLKS